MLSLVPVVALLFSDSTSPLLRYVACTIRKKSLREFLGRYDGNADHRCVSY